MRQWRRRRQILAIYRLGDGSIEVVQSTTFEEEMILERRDLQSAIKCNIEVVLGDCKIIGEEFSNWTSSRKRPDLIGIDKDANIVIFELKRTETGADMELQSIRYAAMISTMTYRQAVEMYETYESKGQNGIDAEQELLDFLEWDEPQEEDFGQDVRVVLVAADFSKEVTSTVIWLNERNIDIRCIRIAPYKYGNDVLLDIQQILPLPEAEDFQIRIRQKNEERREAIRGSRDLTKYRYDGTVYNKRQLVRAVILDWVQTNEPKSFAELEKAFPDRLRRRPVYGKYEEAEETYSRTGIARHFLGEGEVLTFSDGTQYAISNQWGTDITDFIEHARTMGIEIESV